MSAAPGLGQRPEAEEDVLSIVLDALATHAGVDPSRIGLNEPLSAIPGIESVTALRAITEVEDACGVLIPDDFLFETATVEQFCHQIAELRRAKPAG